MKLHAAVLAGVASAFFCGFAAGGDGDWPQWRGPNRNGITGETGYLKQWPEGGPKRLWTAKGFGEGYGTISTLGDLGYMLGDVGGVNGECTLFALNLEDGSIAWKVKVGGPRGSYKWHDPGARSTPTTDGEKVWALASTGEFICVDAKSGREIWRKNLVKDYAGQHGLWMYAESPLLDGDLIVVTPGGGQSTVVALRKDTGAIAWRSGVITQAGAKVKQGEHEVEYTSLLPAEIGGVRQYICMTMNAVAGFDAKNGKTLWKIDRPGRIAICSTPLYADGIVFVASGYGLGCHAYKITSGGGKFSAEEIYAGKQLENHHGDMILKDGHVYGLHDSQGLTCLDLKTGKVVWKNKSVGKGSTVYADGHLVVRAEGDRKKGVKEDVLALVEATPGGYREKGRLVIDAPNKLPKWSHPVLAGGKMYVRDHDVLYCYDVKAR